MVLDESPPVRVRVPATSANLGPGFDAFGLALTWYDEVTARVTGGGLDVEVDGADACDLDRGERHLVVRAMRATFETLGIRAPGLAVRCRNRIPHGRGLGSSAGAVVAGILAARALAGADAVAVGAGAGAADQGAPAAGAGEAGAGGHVEGAPAEVVLALAGEFEGHPDNVAACLAGGLTIAWVHEGQPRFVKLRPSPDIAVVACVPEERLDTGQARRLLPTTVPHHDAAANAARTALLVTALGGRTELLLDATEDTLHQPYRAPAMPHTAKTLERLRTAGVPAVVSGAGPTILALTERTGVDLIAEEVGNGWHVHRLGVDGAGARVQSVAW